MTARARTQPPIKNAPRSLDADCPRTSVLKPFSASLLVGGLEAGLSICRVVSSQAVIPFRSIRCFFQFVGEPAQVVRNVRCAKREIAHRSGRIAEEHRQIFLHGPD